MGRGRQGAGTLAPPAPRKLARASVFAAADERLAYARQHTGGFVFIATPAGVALGDVADLGELQLGVLEPTSSAEGAAAATIVSLANEAGHEEWMLPPLAQLREPAEFTAARARDTEYGELITVDGSLEIDDETATLRLGDRAHTVPALVWLAALSDWSDQTIRNPDKVGRNEPCPCGSGRKHKKCCGAA